MPAARVLVAAGADVMARNVAGETPLHATAVNRRSAPAAVKALLAAGANLNARDEGGNTPLHIAAKFVDSDDRRHAGDAIAALLEAGADPTARNAAGETPWDLAQNNAALKGSDAYWRLNLAMRRGGGRARGGATQEPQQPQGFVPHPSRFVPPSAVIPK